MEDEQEYFVEAEELYRVRTVRKVMAKNPDEARMKVSAFGGGSLERQFNLQPIKVLRTGIIGKSSEDGILELLDGNSKSL